MGSINAKVSVAVKKVGIKVCVNEHFCYKKMQMNGMVNTELPGYNSSRICQAFRISLTNCCWWFCLISDTPVAVVEKWESNKKCDCLCENRL